MVIQALKCKSKQIFFSGIRISMTFPWFFPGTGIPWFFHIREIFFTFSMISLISPWWWAPCVSDWWVSKLFMQVSLACQYLNNRMNLTVLTRGAECDVVSCVHRPTCPMASVQWLWRNALWRHMNSIVSRYRTWYRSCWESLTQFTGL